MTPPLSLRSFRRVRIRPRLRVGYRVHRRLWGMGLSVCVIGFPRSIDVQVGPLSAWLVF